MSDHPETWFDDDAGPLVRPYALTRGRTQARAHDLDLLTLVVAVQPDVHAAAVEEECAQILRECAVPRSVAEVAALVDLPLCVVKVLLSDLIERRYVNFRAAPLPQDAPDLTMLQKVLDGIRKL
jgi:hypothetical protein